MGMYPDFDSSTRSTVDVGILVALWEESSAARKRRRYFLRLAVMSLNNVPNEVVSARIPDGPAPALDTEVYFDPSVPHYPLQSHAWVPSSPDWFAELGALDASEPRRVWWLTRPRQHTYSNYSRPQHPEFPVLVPAGVAESDVVSNFIDDVDRTNPLLLL